MSDVDDEVVRVGTRGEKQLDTLYKAVEPLSKLGFLKFIKCIKRQAYAYNWDEHLYDVGVNALTTAQMGTLVGKRADSAAHAKAHADMEEPLHAPVQEV